MMNTAIPLGIIEMFTHQIQQDIDSSGGDEDFTFKNIQLRSYSLQNKVYFNCMMPLQGGI